MWLDIRPLIKHKDFRYLYLGQVVSTMGSMVTYVALPYQIFQITHSSFAVGMMGVVELIPLLFTAVLGGVYADSMDRRKLLIVSEIGLALGALVLALNCLLPEPSLWLMYGTAGMMSGVNGFHRPALDSLAPRLVNREDIPAMSALNSLKGLLGTIGGPAIGGFLIAGLGPAGAFTVDFLSFALSLLFILKVRAPTFKAGAKVSPLEGIGEGFRYAWSRPELIGSYAIDFVAMVFGMPLALFPALSESMGGVKVVGFLYAAPSLGAMIATLSSGWASKINRSGAAIVLAAFAWGMGITAFGFCNQLWLAVFFLMVAGGADAISGIFRVTLWNQTIPDRLRGRLAGLEMISYMSGPLLGNAESGLVASFKDTQFSVVSGGVLCMMGVVLCVIMLPKFWRYEMPSA